MAEKIDESYFVELKNASADIICRNNRCNYLADELLFSVVIWGDQYLIDPINSSVEYVVAIGPPPHEYLNLFAIYYLLRVKDIPLSEEWISEKDLPGGATFFRGPHLIPTELISGQFGNDLHAFNIWCEKLGGIQIDLADSAFRFQITPDIPVVVLYWKGDEDFPAKAKMLYNRTINEQLPLNVIWALAVGVCGRLCVSTSFSPQPIRTKPWIDLQNQ